MAPDPSSPPEATHPPRRTLSRARGLLSPWLELTKPRLTGLLLVMVAAGASFARKKQAEPVPFQDFLLLLLAAVLGVGLCSAGAAAGNMWLERRLDARMARTRGRPLPSGVLRPLPVAFYTLGLIAAGLWVLDLGTNLLTTALCAGTAGTYVLLYTPLKRWTTLNTFVGALTGAMPPLMGWTAVTGEVGLGAWLLFLILFFWQVPHFLAIAWLYREDYARAGMRMLSVGDDDGRLTMAQIVVFAVGLVPASLLPAMTGLAGRYYFVGALALGVLLLSAALPLVLNRRRKDARLLFLTSLAYLPCLMLVLFLDFELVP